MSLRSAIRVVLASATVAALTLGGLAAAAPVSAAAPTTLPGWLHTSGAEIRNAANEPFVIKAVTWSGLERATCTPVGLTRISLDAGLANIAGLGFNTVRIPFSNECLAANTPANVDAIANPSLFGKKPVQILDTVIARAAAYNLNVVLVRDRVSATSKAKLWYTLRYSQTRWISDWKMLAARYAATSNVIGFDLASNPGSSSCWGCGTKRDWQKAATKAGNAIQKLNNRVLIIVGGVGSSAGGYRSSDGGGLEGVAKKPVTLTRKNHVVYSPHEYSPTINPQKYYSGSKWAKTIPKAWNAHWGYLVTKKIAPVMVGEFGSGITNAKDKTWLRTMVAYLKKKKMSFAYSSFFATSAKSGGLVGDDSTTRTVRSLYLEPLLGLATSVAIKERDPEETPPTPVPEPDGNSATLALVSTWNEGWVGEITVVSEKGVDNWKITFPEPNATAITSTWGMNCSIASGFITCAGTGYESKIPAGTSMKVGLQVASTKAPPSDVGIVVSR